MNLTSLEESYYSMMKEVMIQDTFKTRNFCIFIFLISLLNATTDSIQVNLFLLDGAIFR